MPSLSKHDPLATKQVTLELTIEKARAQNEISVQTSVGLLVLTPETRSRLEAIGAALSANSDPDATVDWVLDDKQVVSFKAGGPESLIKEALALVGEKTQRAFVYSQELKAKFRAGEYVTLRDIAPEKWL